MKRFGWMRLLGGSAPGLAVVNLLQEGPADTTGYMVLGLGVILGSMALYLASLVNRRRNLRRDLQVLDQVESEQRTGGPQQG